MANVLVVFCSRFGAAEQLAMSAAVGAVQSHGSIRLRWIAEQVDPAAITADPRWAEAREQMERDYIAPRDIDLEWAEALVLLSDIDCPELQVFFETVTALRSAGRFHAAVGGAMGIAREKLAGLGIPLVSVEEQGSPAETATALGVKVGASAQGTAA